MKYIKTILLLLVLQSCKSHIWNDKALNLCLRDHGRYSCFVGLRVQNGDTISSCVIMNADLFQYFNEKKATSQEEYERLIKEIVKEKEVLAVSKSDVAKYDFLIFSPSNIVTQDIQKGKDFVLRSYFTKIKDNLILKVALPDEARKELVYALFEWGIISKNDDESGRLYLPFRQFN